MTSTALVLGTLFFSMIQGCFFQKRARELHILTWAHMFPIALIKKFEKEHNIKVVLDFFDSQEVLETKLLGELAGYDIITATSTPFIARYLRCGLLQKIDKNRLKNFQNMHDVFLEKIRSIDPTGEYIIPFNYGTYGILYNKTLFDRFGYTTYPTSYQFFFDPEIMCNYQDMGIGYLNDYGDVFSIVFSHLGITPDSIDQEALKKAYSVLKSARPLIRKFSNDRYENDLVIEELGYAMALSDEGNRAMEESRNTAIELVFMKPESEKTLWIDCIGIPQKSHRSDLAHLFIDYCLDTDNAVALTKHTKTPNSVSHMNTQAIQPHWFLQNVEDMTIPPIKSEDINKQTILFWRAFIQNISA